ncbi:carboxy terminal-processing peptidase [Rhodanobacter denitrificans]|uniref:C-terminal processing peptidase n=4 Tax=Rhodanobacter denitrificans TaxID=666685 RepID=M4NCQ8_9GAMM|nr:carboxy terminal-processing peptidase [Rhodanobacter denitrificans]AGG87577.1 C-terminal processing peptidase [Rhodanobacter denitrificans]UJJ59728.1 carboxy terminal-processing peptidase [Rhodanobacter denitrificans]UJM86750.1 carboxy terminal-processing peptidase [Rhodanobacter denitrificans]UJM90192.1 carboxy terminal-processing peptidase [Rhodanobacter denitrificans]
MKFRPALVLLLAFTATCALAQSAADLGAGKARKAASWPLTSTPEEAQAAQLSARFLTRFHYDAQPLDDAMSARIYTAYFKLLDSEKVFFTQADMAKFAPLKTQLDDAIWNQDLSAPFAVFNLYVQRAVERMNYARGLLKQGFDFAADESYTFDREHADWPKDQAALDDLWRKRTKNDWLRLKLAGKDDAEIRKTLDKRYAGYIERVRQLDGQDAFQTFMTAYAETTDPHTDYLGPRAAENFDISMKLSLEGIGAVLQPRDDYTQVRELVPAGPAAKSGRIQVGDRIVGVGQGDNGPIVDVIGWRLDDVVNLIRGKKDTTVRLEVIPADVGVDGKHEMVSLVRKKVSIEEQAAKKKVVEIKDGDVTRKIGVIELPTFYSDFGARSAGDKNFKSATRDVARLLGELKHEGVQGVVVDLRNNGGGSLAEANSLTGLFIDKGPVVQVRDSKGEVEEQGDDDPGMAWSGPLAVLVNRGTASASEIFSAAIQDYHRGLIIGEPTFGKGTVQNLVDLDRFAQSDSEKPQLGELKMTIQEFFRINGGSTQLKGVTPDIAFPKNGDDKDFGESTYDNALKWTQIAPADYQAVANLNAYLPQLQQKHAERVAQSPAWKLMLDELAQYRTMRAKTAISLNFATREVERKQLEAVQADFRARHKAIDGTDASLADEASSLDDGLNANERSLKSELKQEKEAKKAKDVQLNETAHILFDAIGMIKADPQLASEVLPYGGKFSPHAVASVAAPAPATSGATH